MSEIGPLAGIVSTVAGAVVALIAGYLARRVTEQDTTDARLHLREVLSASAAPGATTAPAHEENGDEAVPRPTDPTPTALLNLEYHAQGIGQSKTMFYVSIAGAALGFAVVIAGVVLALLGRTDAAVVSVVGGVVTDAVSALFFRESNRARDLLRAFFDSLRTDIKEERQLAAGLSLVDQVESSEVRDWLRTVISLKLLDDSAGFSVAVQRLEGSLSSVEAR